VIGATKPNPTFARLFSTFHRTVVRISGGRLLTGFKGEPMILLTTTGRKSGEPRTWPLSALREGDGWVVCASNGGHDRHPAWYLNLEADPEVMVQAGRRTVRARARITEGAERAALFERFCAYLDNYRAYQEATDRVIPLVVLEPVGR